jgi:hypothetical protein
MWHGRELTDAELTKELGDVLLVSGGPCHGARVEPRRHRPYQSRQASAAVSGWIRNRWRASVKFPKPSSVPAEKQAKRRAKELAWRRGARLGLGAGLERKCRVSGFAAVGARCGICGYLMAAVSGERKP